jgi:hypothetical protein
MAKSFLIECATFTYYTTIQSKKKALVTKPFFFVMFKRFFIVASLNRGLEWP